jgi:hypothetical protein
VYKPTGVQQGTITMECILTHDGEDKAGEKQEEDDIEEDESDLHWAKVQESWEKQRVGTTTTTKTTAAPAPITQVAVPDSMSLRIEKCQIQNAVNTSPFISQHLAIAIKIGDETQRTKR